jgi:hypothetical protein
VKKGKKIIVLARPVKPKKIAAAAACCKQGPVRYATGDD